MGTDVTLSADSRKTLVSLQNTTKAVSKTQNRLSTGRKVASASDDAVAFFSARALADRASDLLETKDGIDTGINTIKSALVGLESAEKLITQMKGLALAAKSAGTAKERQTLGEQFNTLRTQLDRIIDDASYQGLNLLADPPSTLTVRLNEGNSANDAKLTVTGTTITSSNLNITPIDASQSNNVVIRRQTYPSDTVVKQYFDDWKALASSDPDEALAQFVSISGFGTTTGAPFSSLSSLVHLVPGADKTIEASETTSADIEALADWLSAFFNGSAPWDEEPNGVIVPATSDYDITPGNSSWDNLEFTLTGGGATGRSWTGTDYLDQIELSLKELDGALITVRSTASSLGSNVAFLQVRREFTASLSNVLKVSADNLVNADLNEEGANMVTLQTRSTLGLSALSFAGQSEQSLLQLF